MAKVDLDSLSLFRLKGSNIVCVRLMKQGKPTEGKGSWQIAIPYKTQGGIRYKYADTSLEAYTVANEWRKKGY